MVTALVPVRTRGNLLPLFCVHGEPQRLAERLNPDRPVYALNFAYATDNLDDIPAAVEDLAKAYIREMQSVQPGGPYYLFGFSAGATIAYEIARQLVAGGFKVAHVCLGEPVLNPRNTRENIGMLARQMGDDGFTLTRLRLMFRAAWNALRRRPGLWLDRLRAAWHQRRGSLMPMRLRWTRYLAHIRVSVAGYRYRRLNCPLDLFYRDMGAERNAVNAEFWRYINADQSTVHFVADGDEHLDLMQDPALSDIAALIDLRFSQGLN